jgi:hypothetical protein
VRESKILRLFDFHLARKRLFLLHLGYWLSGSNSVWKNASFYPPPLVSVI